MRRATECVGMLACVCARVVEARAQEKKDTNVRPSSRGRCRGSARSGSMCEKVLTSKAARLWCASVDARWSSLVARRAHNPKVVGSNPTRATKEPR